VTPIHLRYRLNKQQAGAAFQLSAQRLRQSAGWRRFLFYIPTLGFILVGILPALLHVEGVLVVVWIVGVWLIVFGNVSYWDWFYEKYADDIGECRLALDDDGVLVHTANWESRYVWAAVRAISVQTSGLGIVLGDIQSVLFVPNSAFVDAETRQAFLAAMREHGVAGVPDAVSAERVAAAVETPSSSLFADFAQLGRILTFRAPRAGTLTPDAGKFIFLALLFGVLCVGVQVWEYGFSDGVMYWYGVQELLQPLALVVLIAGLACWIGGKEVDGGRLLLALFLLLLLLPFVDALKPRMENFGWAKYIPVIWIAIVGSSPQVYRRRFVAPGFDWGIKQYFGQKIGRDFWAGAAIIIGIPLLFFCTTLPILWYVPDEDDDYQEREYLHIDERVLYEQPRLLAAALDGVQAGKPGVPELFFLGVGGHRQGVFLREVRAVESLFAERFGTAGHSLLLVNNKDTVGSLPTANLTSLRQALARMGEQMNEEDTLFLLLASHGSPDHRFIFDLWSFSFTDLSPEELRQALDAAHIKRRVVVVSSCYSGGFIPALQDENTLVITAAAADRASFGCNDENEFTEFGRAYFDEALRQTHSFTRAFALASERIAAREKAEGLVLSLPQMSVGSQVTED
jgi:hypothetical protein